MCCGGGAEQKEPGPLTIYWRLLREESKFSLICENEIHICLVKVIVTFECMTQYLVYINTECYNQNYIAGVKGMRESVMKKKGQGGLKKSGI